MWVLSVSVGSTLLTETSPQAQNLTFEVKEEEGQMQRGALGHSSLLFSPLGPGKVEASGWLLHTQGSS